MTILSIAFVLIFQIKPMYLAKTYNLLTKLMHFAKSR